MESFAFGVAEAREQFVMDRFGVSLELPKILPAGVGEADHVTTAVAGIHLPRRVRETGLAEVGG